MTVEPLGRLDLMEPAAFPTSVLRGRDIALETLGVQLDRVRSGVGAAVLVEGFAGEAAFEKAVNTPNSRKFLEDAGEQVLIRKGAPLRESINREYEALGRVARALNLTPQ